MSFAWVYVHVCVSYRRSVIGKCLQVSHIGVDEPPRALNLGANIMIRRVGN